MAEVGRRPASPRIDLWEMGELSWGGGIHPGVQAGGGGVSIRKCVKNVKKTKILHAYRLKYSVPVPFLLFSFCRCRYGTGMYGIFEREQNIL